MKKLLPLILIAGFAFGANAQDKKFQIGLVLGPTFNWTKIQTTKIERNGIGNGFTIGVGGNYMFNEKDEFGLSGWESLAKHSQNNGDTRTLSQQYKAAKERDCQDYILRHLQQYRLTLWYHTHTFLSTIERFIDGEVTSHDLFGYNNEIYSIYSDLEHNVTDFDSLYDVVEKYNSRLKMSIDNSTDTLQQFEELHKRDSHFAEFGHQESNILF